MSEGNDGGAAVSGKSLRSPQSAILAIVKNAGKLLQLCKSDLPQTSAVEATTSAVRHVADRNNADFASRPKFYASDAAVKITTAEMSRDNALSIARHIDQARRDIAANRVKA
ncbi:MAG: hypothetical protein ACREDV_08975 [Methylocella sp.]